MSDIENLKAFGKLFQKFFSFLLIIVFCSKTHNPPFVRSFFFFFLDPFTDLGEGTSEGGGAIVRILFHTEMKCSFSGLSFFFFLFLFSVLRWWYHISMSTSVLENARLRFILWRVGDCSHLLCHSYSDLFIVCFFFTLVFSFCFSRNPLIASTKMRKLLAVVSP